MMLRLLILTDLFFLLVYVMNRQDLNTDFHFQRCREVQKDPNGNLDLWAREHGKSSIITLGLTVQDILNNPELTVGIFSHNRPTAKSFMRQIMREFESNELLKATFPEVLWNDPKKEAPKWSEDDGLIVKRKTNPKESTVEAWGLVDGQPTGKHYKLMIYDDVVTIDSVTGPEMIRKVTEAWELSRNLTSEGGATRYIGTRYKYADTYNEIMKRQAARPRIYPGTKDGTIEGEPFLWTRERLAEKRREMGPYTFAAQIMQNPTVDTAQGFRREWVRFYQQSDGSGMNKAIIVDPANEKKKTSDYTAIMVLGFGADQNLYVLEMVRDRMNLAERAGELMRLHQKWRPLRVGYERYGMQADIQHIKIVQEQRNYRFNVEELHNSLNNNDRIKWLIPWFEQGRIWLPPTQYKVDYEKKTHDLVEVFLTEEFDLFPVPVHDDMLTALAWGVSTELNMTWPKLEEEAERRSRYQKRHATGWMTR